LFFWTMQNLLLKAITVVSGFDLFGIRVASVQTGEVNFNSGTTEDIPISSVDVDNSIVLMNFNAVGASKDVRYYFVLAKLTSPTNLRLEKVATSSSYYPVVTWQVIELKGVKSLQTGEVNFNSGTTEDIPISSVNINKSIVLVNFKAQGSSEYLRSHHVTAKLMNSTTLRLERGYGTPTVYPIVFWQVIEF
jgi:hypothetical protein